MNKFKRAGAIVLTTMLICTNIQPVFAEDFMTSDTEQENALSENLDIDSNLSEDSQNLEIENESEDVPDIADVVDGDEDSENSTDSEIEFADDFSSDEESLSNYDVEAEEAIDVAQNNEDTEMIWTSNEVTVSLVDDILTVSGNGAMKDYNNKDSAPWNIYATSIHKIVLESGVTKIGEQAFCKSGVTTVEFPDTLQEISEAAFLGCTELTQVTLPGSVKKIGRGAFADCTSLDNLVLSNGVQEIADYAFQSTVMAEVFIPASVTSVSKLSFFKNRKLSAYNVDTANTSYSSIEGILFDKSATTLIHYPLGKTNTSYRVPDGVQTIGASAFQENGYLVSVNIPDTVQTIGEWAFANCKSIQSFTIPDSVTKLGYGILDGCSSLSWAVVGNGIEILEYREFSNCTALTKVMLGSNLKTIDMRAFYECRSLSDIILPQGLETINGSAFYNCVSLTNIRIPASVTCVENSAFSGCSNLTVQYPEGLEKQEDGSYRKLEHINISGTRHYDSAYQVLDIVNQERAKEGLTPLAMDQNLLDAAMKRAAEVCVDFSHTRPSQMSCFSVSSKISGENIAAGSSTAAGVMKIWMDSPGHRANILTSSYQSIGIGCFEQGNAWFWVQVFGNSEAVTSHQPQNCSVTESVAYVYKEYKDQFWLRATNYRDDVYVGKTLQLQPAMINKGWDYVSAKLNAGDFSWSSTNPSVASVNNLGVVTGESAGDATITAMADNISVSLLIHVKEKSDSNGNNKDDQDPGNYGDDYDGYYDNYYDNYHEEHSWSAWEIEQSPSVFQTGVKMCKCKICGLTRKSIIPKETATGKANMSTVRLQIKQKTAAFKITGMAKGDYIKSYQSSNKKIFTVTKNGKLTAKKVGSAKIIVTLASGKKITSKVVVQKQKVKTTKITSKNKSVYLMAGQSDILKVQCYPYTTQEKVTYKSSDSKIVTVNKNGKITAKKKGTTRIIIKSGKKKIICKVRVF